MIFYLIIIFISVIGYHLTKKQNCLINIFFSIFLPSFFAGFRDTTVGYDIEVYLTRLWGDCVAGYSFKNILINNDLIEYGYCLFTYFVSLFFSDICWLLLIEHILVLSLIVLAIRKLTKDVNNTSVGTVLYAILLIFLYNSSLCYARQFMALGIYIYSSYFLLKTNYIKYMLFILIATLFHGSAIFMLLLIPLFYVIYTKRISDKKLQLLIIILGLSVYIAFPLIIIFLVSHNIINPKYLIYADKEYSSHKIDYLVCLFIYILTLRCSRIGKTINKNYITIVRSLCLMSVFLTMCGVYDDVASRIVMYLFIFQFILLCLNLTVLSIRKMNLYLKIFLLFILLRYTYLGSQSNFNQTIPYTSKILNI